MSMFGRKCLCVLIAVQLADVYCKCEFHKIDANSIYFTLDMRNTINRIAVAIGCRAFIREVRRCSTPQAIAADALFEMTWLIETSDMPL